MIKCCFHIGWTSATRKMLSSMDQLFFVLFCLRFGLLFGFPVFVDAGSLSILIRLYSKFSISLALTTSSSSRFLWCFLSSWIWRESTSTICFFGALFFPIGFWGYTHTMITSLIVLSLRFVSVGSDLSCCFFWDSFSETLFFSLFAILFFSHQRVDSVWALRWSEKTGFLKWFLLSFNCSSGSTFHFHIAFNACICQTVTF